MISWLETTTAAVSKVDTYSSSTSGTYAVGTSIRSSTSSTSSSGSENWSETYQSTTAYYRSFDGTNETLNTTKLVNGVAVPNSGSARQTITDTTYAQTSTTAEATVYPIATITSEVAASFWTTSASGDAVVFYQTEGSKTVTTSATTEVTASEYGTTEATNTVYDVPWHNTIYRAISEHGEVLFSANTSNAANYFSESLATGVSATRLTATFNTETTSYLGTSSFATQTNDSLTASFVWSEGIATATTRTVCSFAFRIPQQTRTLAGTSRSTTNSQRTDTYFNSNTVSPAQQTAVWFVSTTKQTTSDFESQYEHTTTRLASATRWTQAPHLALASNNFVNGASRGVSVTTQAPPHRLATTYQDTVHASYGAQDDVSQLRKVFGPFGRSAQGSVGAALSFAGITNAFTVPTSSHFEVVADREASEGTSGSVFRLMPGLYSYNPINPAGSASLSISGDSFSFTTKTSNTITTSSTTTSGVANAHGPSFVTQRLVRPFTSYNAEADQSTATQAASLNLVGFHVVGGALGLSETAVERIPRGIWLNGSTTAFYQGDVTTRTANVATTALVPLPCFFPQLATQTKATSEGNNLIWATAVGDPIDLAAVATTALPLPF